MDLFDLIGPVMIGPSSSHTAGAARIGLTARRLMGEELIRADIGLHGSFAKTYRGHGTDRALVGGLMGMDVDDERLRDSLNIAREAGMVIHFQHMNIRGAHPNTVRLTVTGVSGRVLEVEAASVGGGNIEVHKIDGLSVNFTGKENTIIIRHMDTPGAIAAVTGILASKSVNIANVQGYRRQQGGDAMIVMELDGVPQQEVLDAINALPGVQGSTFLARRSDL
ncbi:MAG: L-serine ammonia-lyase, iron-sulfur-dependent, subunit beta [Clostridiales bacterium]|nr:L-serine ammonia-lyase, iron-sulfur-dependent, subunit beta [Clostridiales bacterium]